MLAPSMSSPASFLAWKRNPAIRAGFALLFMPHCRLRETRGVSIHPEKRTVNQPNPGQLCRPDGGPT
jgi:hypothetical protein